MDTIWVVFQDKKCFIVHSFEIKPDGSVVVKFKNQAEFTFLPTEISDITVEKEVTELSIRKWTEDVFNRFYRAKCIDGGEDGELPGQANIKSKSKNVSDMSNFITIIKSV